MTKATLAALRCAFCLLICTSISNAGTIIDFDELATDPGTGTAEYPGDTYIDQCVNITSTRTSLPAENIGQILEVRDFVDAFQVSTDVLGPAAISQPNFVLPVPGRYDLLMSFTDPVSYIALTTDKFNEGPDTVRLVGLVIKDDPNTPNVEFEVVAIDTGQDDATSPPDNLLELNYPAGLSYVLFQVGFTPTAPFRELEGFDNLMFQKSVPEPSTFALTAIVVACCLAGRRRR